MRLWPLLLTLPSAACTTYTCGDIDVMGEAHGEWCGPLGSFGQLFIDEGMVRLIFTVDDNLDGELDLAEQILATWQAHFRTNHLEPGTTVPADGLVATCSYFSNRTFITVPADVAEVRVVSPSNRSETGGESFRMAWEVTCSDAQLSHTGNDILELSWKSGGYDGPPPADDPQEQP